jgi:mono/diheme cytochrome c family protein
MLAPAFRRSIVALAFLSTPLAAAPVDYARDIEPLFAKHCVSCHGPAKQKGGLRLDSGARVLAGSLNGPVIVPKESNDSLLVHVLYGEGDAGPMPPKGPLADDEIRLISRWIDEGATVPAVSSASHWSFVPPRAADVPAGIHPVDHFLTPERSRLGLRTAPPADRATILKRVTLDLTGLPPTAEEIESFVRDTSSDAYERRVDAMLASPRYGERWGRHFLDVWRYADWYGYGAELRNSQKHIWNWRDWVVESLNRNVPYDTMVRSMLAGDEIAPEDPSTVRATGYLARSYYKFNRNAWLDAVVEHTGKAFLGITLNCCRCHDHMYDTLSQEEYYRFRAIFEPHQVRLDFVPGEADPDKRGLPRVYDADLKAVTVLFERGDEKRPVADRPLAPGVPAAISPTRYEARERKLPAKVSHPILHEHVRNDLIGRAQKDVETAKTEPRKLAATLQLRALHAKLNADAVRYTKSSPERVRHAVALHLEAALASAEADVTEADEVLGKERSDAKSDPKKVASATKRVADAKAKVDAARKALESPPADYPPLAPNYPETTSGRRAALADWVTSTENPLTARVLVNHVWLRHFGRPLVPTVFDFGKNGRPPSHPALLNWLAVAVMKSNWDIKALHRLLVTSDAYRMESGFSDANGIARDPDNVYLWRMNARPLEAEAIRDRLLFASELLDETRGGPELDVNDEAPQLRRSLYYRHAPEKVMPFLAVFDGPSPTECYRRAETVVPQQAMALVNGRLSARAAEAVASLAAKAPASVTDALFLRVLGRLPDADERALCDEYLTRHPPASLARALFSHADFSTIR